MVTNQYFDTLGKVGRGEEGLGDAAGEIFGAYSKGKDNEWAAKEQAAKPIVDDVKSGNYAGAFGRFGTQLGVAILGMGEEGPARRARCGGVGGGGGRRGGRQGGGAVEPGISPAAKSVPNPQLRPLEPPISPEAQSVPKPNLTPLEGPISPEAQSVPNPNLTPLEGPISPEAQSVPNPNLRPLEGPISPEA